MKIEGLDRLFRKIEQLKNIDIKPIIEDATIRVRDEARKNAPVNKYKTSSELQNSIDYNVETTGKGCVGKVFTNKEYGLYVELGTGPNGEANHSGISPEIKPIYSPSGWAYFDKDLDRFIFTKGQPARPFMYPALHDNREKLSKFIKFRIRQKIKEATK